jgi:hypothetical protein
MVIFLASPPPRRTASASIAPFSFLCLLSGAAPFSPDHHPPATHGRGGALPLVPPFPYSPPTSFMAGGDKSPNPNINPQGTAVCANPSPSPCCHLTLSWLHHHLFLLRCPPLPRPHPQSDSSTRGSLTAMGSYSCSSGAMRSSRRVSCLISSRDKGEDE